MLVPEISLTKNMLRRFKQRFDHIAILHSGLSASEKYDEYRLISQNKVNIVTSNCIVCTNPENLIKKSKKYIDVLVRPISVPK